MQGAAIANLRKYNSIPPVWFLDVNGEPLELDTEALLNQATFQKACLEQLNFMPRTVGKPVWEGRIGALMSEMRDNESAIIDVAEDASISGQFYDYLEEFCAHMQKANDKSYVNLIANNLNISVPETFRPKSIESFGLIAFSAF